MSQPTTNETGAVFRTNGAVELYWDNAKKFETYQYGIRTTQNIDIGLHAYWPDSGEANFGANQDFQIYHNGSQTYLDNKVGHLYLRNHETNSNNIYATVKEGGEFGAFKNGTSEWLIKTVAGGSCELWYDGSKKFETTANGAQITGRLDLNGGYISLDDNYSVLMGTDGDGQLYHSGSHQYLLNTVGNTYIMPKAGETAIKCEPDGEVELYWDNNLRFETHGTGVSLRSTSPSSGSAEHWSEGSIKPWANNTYDLGDASYRWRALHVNDGIYFEGNNTTATQLDDYEEGTFTPDWNGANTGGTTTYGGGGTYNYGKYTKIGNVVHLSLIHI